MERRFGHRIRKLTAGTFLILRVLAEGVRVFAISIVVSIVLGTGEIASIILIVCLTLFYTFEGGMTAVIWTDVVQMFLYIAGAIVSLFVILGKIPLGWEHVMEVTGSLGKLQVFDFRFAFDSEFFSRTYNFWSGLVGGAFLTTAPRCGKCIGRRAGVSSIWGPCTRRRRRLSRGPTSPPSMA